MTENVVQNGFVFLDKAPGMSSFYVVKKIKNFYKNLDPKKFSKIKIGHSGTLDPIASGLMIIGIGEATKLLGFLLGEDKAYEVEGEFGKISDTYDADGEVKEVASVRPVSLDVIKKVIQENFVGEIKQVPPNYSAKKVDGQRAYDLARKGREFSLMPKKITVYGVTVESFEWPKIKLKISGSSGTYVRSLVHDLGRELKCGAYVTALRRISIGNFSVSGAIDPDKFKLSDIVPMEEVFEKFPSVNLSEGEFRKIVDGYKMPIEDVKLCGQKSTVNIGDKRRVFVAKVDDKIRGLLEMTTDGKGDGKHIKIMKNFKSSL